MSAAREEMRLDVPLEFHAPEPAGDKVTSFELILDHYQKKLLQVPVHQRAPEAWPPLKRRKYVDRLRNVRHGSQPLGTIATYQVIGEKGDAGPTFLNDGLQRLSTLDDLKANPSRYDMAPDGVDQLLRQDVSTQHRHYRSDEEAMRDFQFANFGTPLTAYELCRGYLEYMPSYERNWAPVFMQVKAVMTEAAARLRGSGGEPNRKTLHKHWRHDHALFYRFLVNEQSPKFYRDIGRDDVQEFIDPKDVIELHLRGVLQHRGPEEAANQARLFCRFVNDQTALIEKVRDDVLGAGVGIQAVLWRWLLDFGVWRRATKTTVARQQQFVGKVLDATRGSGQLRFDDGRTAVTFGLANLSTLPKVAEHVGMPDLCARQRRSRSGHSVRPGYQSSHLEPFAEVGDGPTFAEPGPLNMARGAKDVEPDESPGDGKEAA